MSTSSVHALNGVSIDVDALFQCSFDFSHLRLTIATILEALAKQDAKNKETESKLAEQEKRCEEMEGKVDEQSKTLAANSEKLDAAERDLASAKDELKDLEKRESATAERVDKLEDELQKLRDENGKMKKMVQDAADRAARAEAAAKKAASNAGAGTGPGADDDLGESTPSTYLSRASSDDTGAPSSMSNMRIDDLERSLQDQLDKLAALDDRLRAMEAGAGGAGGPGAGGDLEERLKRLDEAQREMQEDLDRTSKELKEALRDAATANEGKINIAQQMALDADARARAAQAAADAAAALAAGAQAGKDGADGGAAAAVPVPVPAAAPSSGMLDGILDRFKSVNDELASIRKKMADFEKEMERNRAYEKEMEKERMKREEMERAKEKEKEKDAKEKERLKKEKEQAEKDDKNAQDKLGTGRGFGGVDTAALQKLASDQMHTSKQLASVFGSLKELQGSIAALDRALVELGREKASTKSLANKADQKALDALAELVASHTRAMAHHNDDLNALRNEIDAMNALRELVESLVARQQGLEEQVVSIIENMACNSCQKSVPAFKCEQCNMHLCSECDEKRHGKSATEEMQKHVRKPLAGQAQLPPLVVPPQTTPAPVAPAPKEPKSGLGHSGSSGLLPRGQSTAVDKGSSNVQVVLGSSGVSPAELQALRRWAEEQFALLQRKDSALRGDIVDLQNKVYKNTTTIVDIGRKQEEDRETIERIIDALKKIETDFGHKIKDAQAAARTYTDNRFDELAMNMRSLEKQLGKDFRNELKRFERDILAFIEATTSSAHGTNDASIGKIHFRCLTCDQAVSNLQGPSSLLYAKAVGNAANGPVVNPGGTAMNIERGRELYLNGRDGAVYKGRESSLVTLVSSGAKGERPASFSVHYGERMSTTNPRGTTILEHKTVHAPVGAQGREGFLSPPSRQGAYQLRPLSAGARGDTASTVAAGGSEELLAGAGSTLPRRESTSSLPPTRPSTRSRGSRASPTQEMDAQRESTPLRQEVLQANAF